jgi:NAD(P)-dependent dehydrogenase (short-subunit alcohol dehydrogenase family)
MASGTRFAGKVVLVTGGNSGIGLTTARAFLDEGGEVVVTGRDQSKVATAVASLGAKASGVPADLLRLADIDRLMQTVRERHGRIDVLFANAGVARMGAIGTMTEADWDEIMGANAKGLYFTVQRALPLMGKGAAIVLNASVAGSIGAPDCSIYAASTAAVQSLTRRLGAELVASGIRVNAVSPGPVETPIFGTFGLTAEGVEGIKKEWAAGNPMHRLGGADEVARAVLFLASSDAGFITGANLPVDGGLANF